MPLPYTTLIDPISTDGLQLSGLLFEPSWDPKTAIVYLHGNGSKGIFYAHEWNRIVTHEFGQAGLSYCTFNNRGGMLTTSLDVCNSDGQIIWKKNAGVWYEKIEDCVKDIDGVMSYLKNFGYDRFFLMGKSTGANKICVYHQILKQQGKKSPFAGYILLSGGDDVGLWYEDMGSELFHKVLENARNALDEKRGEDRPIMRRCFLEDFSYQSAYDILSPDGLYNCFPFYEAFRERLWTKEFFQEYSQLDIPTLVVYGDSDEYVRFPMSDVVDTLRSHNAWVTYEVLPGANHSFGGHEKILSEKMVAWIDTIQKN